MRIRGCSGWRPECDAGQRLVERDRLHYDDLVELRVPARRPHVKRNPDALNIAVVGTSWVRVASASRSTNRSISLVSALIQNSNARPPSGVRLTTSNLRPSDSARSLYAIRARARFRIPEGEAIAIGRVGGQLERGGGCLDDRRWVGSLLRPRGLAVETGCAGQRPYGVSKDRLPGRNVAPALDRTFQIRCGRPNLAVLRSRTHPTLRRRARRFCSGRPARLHRAYGRGGRLCAGVRRPARAAAARRKCGSRTGTRGLRRRAGNRRLSQNGTSGRKRR